MCCIQSLLRFLDNRLAAKENDAIDEAISVSFAETVLSAVESAITRHPGIGTQSVLYQKIKQELSDTLRREVENMRI